MASWLKTEWFYVKVDEKKEKPVQSPLELIFGETRPQCNIERMGHAEAQRGKEKEGIC
jgi:hypothetical protein